MIAGEGVGANSCCMKDSSGEREETPSCGNSSPASREYSEGAGVTCGGMEGNPPVGDPGTETGVVGGGPVGAGETGAGYGWKGDPGTE